ncbi:similar to Saccharomyces cerevisiae YKL089W MIF2 Kinetochore protein with homology to human CENP-C [Maudiozyma barnettii]|uniref:CENP-C homolog n=1 Tax=Maudiozyma barnettii TaxID=61262 RepID=A0A8H2VKS8_9SACH|nr:Mif2p [Kazachstania barnettii]CAB4257173.1 similar to Saccharomyces cerevisiae YKL089W MIF2 Kinetochore protein with homology to human CENP-C [Kazachstania barnettii]CAD1779543.1 similar to Saccharomyces cerevisiae YKL089W MIF2 Kinetochore protein with homology to human CENP-C [Kazachstania barnettii]
MDFMNLGVTSRKTGLRVKNNVAKDEYNMENVEDFFKDDEASMITVRKSKSMKTSLLAHNRNSLIEERSNNETSRFSTPHIFSPAISDTRRLSSIPINISREQSQDEQPPNILQDNFNSNNLIAGHRNSLLESIHEEPFDYGQENTFQTNDTQPNLRHSLTPSVSLHRYNTTYDLNSTRRTSLNVRIPPKDFVNPYTESEAPDLVHDADLTIDNTSFNTSDNAILEEEMSEYGIEKSDADDDMDYNTDILSSDESSSAEQDIDEDDNNGQDILNDLDSTQIDKTYIPSDDDDYQDNESVSQNNQLPTDFSDLSSDEDEEYLPSQANISNPIIAEGPKRSTRIKVPPLEYWRNEKVVYKRRDSKPYLDIEKIVTYEPSSSSEDEAGAKTRSKRIKKAPQLNNSNLSVNESLTNIVSTIPRQNEPSRNFRSINNRIIRGRANNETSNPDSKLLDRIHNGKVKGASWIQDGFLEGTINSAIDKKSKEVIAYAPNISQVERTKRTSDNKYTLSVMFDKHKEMFASGILKLPPTGLRDITESHNAFITFYVIRGIVEVTVGTNKFITPAGCSFQVPSFNSYSFKNKGKEEVQLFFVQVIVPETFNSQQDPANHSNKGDVSDKDGFSMSDDESSKMVNLKDRHISDSQTKIRPSAIQQKLFISSSSSNL